MRICVRQIRNLEAIRVCEILEESIRVFEIGLRSLSERRARVESEVETRRRSHHRPDMSKTFLDMLWHQMREDTLGQNVIEAAIRKEPEIKSATFVHPEVGPLMRQPLLTHECLACRDDLRRQIEAAVIAGIKVVDEMLPAPQAAAADIQQAVLRSQALITQELELSASQSPPMAMAGSIRALRSVEFA